MYGMKIVWIAYGALFSLFAVTFCLPDNQEEAINLNNDYFRWPNDYSLLSPQWTSDELAPLYSRSIYKYPLIDLIRYSSRLKKTNVAPPPPGFVGARGRRGNTATITELSDYLASNLGGEESSAFNAWLKQQRPATNKKADLAMYKDGFIGARG